MQQFSLNNRRAFIKWMGALPLLGYMSTQSLCEKVLAAAKQTRSDNCYTRIGLKTIINARGPWSYMGGTLELPEVKAVQQEAARYFVNMWELQRAAGRRLAELSGAQAGLVTSGRRRAWQPQPRRVLPAPTRARSGNFPTPMA